MQCRCRKITIIRRVVERLTDYTMREICRLLMNGRTMKAVRRELDLPEIVLDMFIEELRRLLIEAGLKVRGAWQ